MKIEAEIPLSDLTTFRIGGKAKYFAIVRTITELKEALELSKKKNVPFYVIGEGSNILAPDKGYGGLIIKNEIRGVKVKEDGTNYIVESGAGENWDDFVSFCVFQKLYGLENLSYIPGTVGAAPVQNIGAYGAEVGDVIDEVEVLDSDSMNLLRIANKQCYFGYRDSIFKREKNSRLVITKVFFRLNKHDRVNIGYKDLRERFKNKYSKDVTLEEVREAVIEIRKRKLPDWTKTPTAGSFFKNPFITKSHYARLKTNFPGIPGFEEKGRVKIPLAWVLDKICNLRGFKIGKVGLHENQPLAFINLGGATAENVEAAAAFIGASIKEKTGINVEWEVRKVE